MGRSIARRVVAVVAVGLLVAACSSSKKSSSHGGGGSGDGVDGSGGEPSNVSTSCQPGAQRCEGLNVKVCDASGAREEIDHTCSPGESCTSGACVVPACPPNATYCQGQAVMQCDALGQSSKVVSSCPAAMYCRDEQGKASCSSQACAPGSALCDGSVATVCLSDGSGPKPGGVDCADSAQACYGGGCHEIACKPGTKLCQHDDVYLCGQNGTDLLLWADCQAGEVCDLEQGACRAKVCDANKITCDGTRIVTCNAFGSAVIPSETDCAADDKVCVNGSCRARVCTPNVKYCEDNSVYQCDTTGTSTGVYLTCGSSEHCYIYGNGTYGSCQSNDCSAGTVSCIDNQIKTCTDKGFWPAAGTPCGANQYCDGAACVDRICTVGSLFCKGDDVYYCPDSGAPYLSTDCYEGMTCEQVGDSPAVCSPLYCDPGSVACVGNKIGTCGADGKSIASVTDDCAATSLVCSSDLKCAASASDTLGIAESVQVVSAGVLVGDAIKVHSARQLTEFQVQLALAQPRELRWVIYELVGGTYVARLDKLVSSVSGTGFISSGSFKYPLKAGKSYLLGVVVGGGDGVAYYDSAPFPSDVSFGSILGSAYISYYASVDMYNVYSGSAVQIKVATGAP